MKIRSDFVSNSSSSSFIIADNNIFNYFEITKNDIVNALIDLYGKDEYEQYQKDQKERRKDPDVFKWLSNAERKYPNEVGPFYVYDLTNKTDRRKASELWGDLLRGWDSIYLNYDVNDKRYVQDRKNRNYHQYENVCRKIAELYHLNTFDGVVKSEDEIANVDRFVRTNERQPNGNYGYTTKKGCKDIAKFLLKIRKDMGILSNKDILKLKFSKFFIHFDDNEICNLDGINVASRHDRPYENATREYELKRNKEIETSIYNSDCYSNDRLFEILFNYFVSKKHIIKVADKYFLKAAGYPKDKKTLDYIDLVDNLIAGCFHEG